MILSKETQEKINELFNGNEEMKARLLEGNPDAIREVGTLAQMWINPEDVVSTFESEDKEAMQNLYKKAKTMVGLRDLYKVMCEEYSKNTIKKDAEER